MTVELDPLPPSGHASGESLSDVRTRLQSTRLSAPTALSVFGSSEHLPELASSSPYAMNSERTRRRSHVVVKVAPAEWSDAPLQRDTHTATSDFADTSASALRIEQFEITERAETTSLERKAYDRKRYLHFAAICWVFIVTGWNDGTAGPLIPRLQEYYHIGFTVVSLIFVFNCVGYLAGATMNIYLTDKIGFGKVLVMGASLQLAAYALQSIGGPFPVMLTGYVFAGFGIATQIAQGTGFVGSFNKNGHLYMGFLQAAYGLGALVAPLVATRFAQMRHWSFYFLISAGLAATNVLSLFLVFRLRTQDVVMADAGQEPGEADTAGGSKYSQILRLKALHILAAFALLYTGVEFTLASWIVTFVIHKRGGGSSAGYISSGFFGGMTLGRVVLIWVNRIVGERRILYIYMVLAIGLEVTVWVVPSLVENAIAVSAIGFLFGPMYPIFINHAAHILPGWLLTGSLGWIAGFGQTGSAMLPFITGVLASQHGIASLQPLLIAMMSTLLGIWFIIPNERVRVD